MNQREKTWNPLEARTYRFKKHALQFFCPLCRTERCITIGHRLTYLNYMQITLLTALVTASLYSVAGLKTLAVFFPIWLTFEMTRRMLFSKEVPCPHCGFDASWYKRDVKVARKRVAEFWDQKTPTIQPANENESQLSP
ncbi:MAG: hypothetical protein K9K67_00015 [Bacteriovoracaceae bacterium]|nr:hypothetical protein [Bacteriovoracaceae bacterium]